MATTWQEVAAIAQKRRLASLPVEHLLGVEEVEALDKEQNVTNIVQTSGHFTPTETTILTTELVELLQKIHSREWSAVEVMKAYVKSATVAQQLTNCLTEILFVEALQTAQEQDDYLQKHGRPVGPLHGLPISLKDSFITPSHPSSIGMTYFANESTAGAPESIMVRIVRKCGAIPFVKTNVPVAMMMMETINHVWGETHNPHHLLCNAGGSSGGEGALIAMYGSPLGLGTDIGGSIRIPSAFCGLYGLKPSFGRYPVIGGKTALLGQEYIMATNGPMSRSLDSLVHYSAAVLSNEMAPWALDPKCIPIPWRTGPQVLPQGRKLRIAMVPPFDGLITPQPPILRGLLMTRKALEAQGHEVLEWAPDDHPGMVKDVLASFFTFGGSAIKPLLDKYGEPLYGSMLGYAAAHDQAQALANSGDSRTASEVFSADRMREMNIKRNTWMKTILDRWQATAIPAEGKGPIDGIVQAVSPWAAPRNGISHDEKIGGPLGYFGYTAWINLLDLPSCVFPVTKADRSLDKVDPQTIEAARAQAEAADLNEKIQADFDPEFYHGTPVCLQLIGQRLHEEKVLEVVGYIRDALNAADGGHR